MGLFPPFIKSVDQDSHLSINRQELYTTISGQCKRIKWTIWIGVELWLKKKKYLRFNR